MRIVQIIVVLLLLNLGLLVMLLQRSSVNARVQEAPAAPSKGTFQALREKNLAAHGEVAPEPAQATDFKWAQLEAEDYRTYIERLREIGCPEQTIRDIIIADLDKLMAADMRAIEGPPQTSKYWQPQNKDLINLQESLQKLERKQHLDFEKRAVISELLGVDLAAERLRQRGERDFYSERLGFMPEEKQARVRMIMESANQEELQIREKAWLQEDRLSSEDKGRLRQVEARKQQEVAALLTPEELEQYNLWFSPSAYKVRDAFFTMEPTEEEFLAVYELQRSFDEAWSQIDPAEVPPAEKQGWEQAKREFDQQVQERLGAERFAQWREVQDRDYRELRAAAAQFNLPPQAAEDVQQVRQMLLEHRQAVGKSTSLDEQQRMEIFQALAEESETMVVELIGPRAYKYYLRMGGGKWLRE